MFCRESVAALRQQVETNPNYPPVVMAFRGEPEGGRRFLENHWPTARAIADPDGSLFETFGLYRATLKQAAGPAVMRRAVEAFRRGFGVGLPGRDVLRMPGLFLIRKPYLVASRRFSHVGDHPDFSTLAEWAAAYEPSALPGENNNQRVD